MSGAPTLPVLGSSTLNRKWCFEFKIAGVYTMAGGVMNSQFQPSTPNWVDNTDQSGQGGTSQNKTAYTHTGNLTLDRKRAAADPTQYDAGQEFLRLASLAIGPANTVEFRVFEYDFSDPNGLTSPRVEAYHGFAGVEWVPAGGDMNADDTVAVTLNGQGRLDPVSHPYPAAAAVPTVSASSANIPVAGGPFRLVGSRFTGTTAVNIAGAAATSFTVWSDGEITGVAAAHAAGTGLPAIVTNAVGASTAANVVAYA